MKAITRFQDQYGFLSNFWPSPIQYIGRDYATVEHAYQAAKTLDPQESAAIQGAATPGHAKRLGQACSLRPDWDEVKVGIMHELLQLKFQDPELRGWLLGTGAVEIRGEGKNVLGLLLMQIRDEVRNGAAI